MPFNIALSGIRAANDDLRITGNNIANASTTGFKKSRAEFGDVYASSIGSEATIGSGVRVQDVSQQFQQGNISFTDNILDLAVSGSGFFVISLNGDQTFTRAGAFGLDSNGYIVNNINARLQGFNADSNGNVNSLPSDIQISTRSLQPQLTSEVSSEVNVDSGEIPPQTAYRIDAANIGTLDTFAGSNITIGVTNPSDVETPITFATTGAVETASDMAAILNDATGVRAVVTAGGDIDIILAEGYTLTNNTVAGLGISPLDSATTTSSTIGFDPTDSSTYNHSTAQTIYDSLGNPHILQQYFIKQPIDPANVAGTANRWQMAVQIDGHNVGVPTNTADPVNTATLAVYDLEFTPRGLFDAVSTGDIDITNWTPLDTSGNVIGAEGPPTSNIEISMVGSKQQRGDFEVRDADQNGTTTGRLAGLSIDDTGFIFARYTNGQNRVLAQVALADFSNSQGLEPVSDTAWAETVDSGTPLIGEPGTASLGLVQSGALEESNVDLSGQLVNLIIAQRNFQASAKTIETADQTTQTIINLR